MKSRRFLLDCTLRDGGYINDWAFGKDNISYIFERQVSSGVDVIEVGFLDERRPFDPDRTIMPDTAAVDRIFGAMDKGRSMTVAMIDYGTCGIDKLSRCEDSWLDGIRVIFKKEIMHEAIAFCREVKALGYLVFAQAVSITSYNDDELRELVGLVNGCMPYAFSMVDTYGLLDGAGLDHIISVIDRDCDPSIILGYHAHNNFQLGYANAVGVLNTDLSRDILVDGTLYGMGKSAGNAPIELVAMYMNLHFGKNYDVLEMQEAISTCLLDLYRVQPWGYTLFYYIAALNRCHPNYVSWLMNKRTLSISSVNEILQRIPEAEKLGKNMKLLEQLYLEYQNNECDDAPAFETLKNALGGRPVLLIGPGKSLLTAADRVREYAKSEKLAVIAVNYVPGFVRPDFVFLTNSRRYIQLAGKVREHEKNGIRFIATSNVKRADGVFDLTLNYSGLIDPEAEFPDNSMIMLLKALMKAGVRETVLAGFDGYTQDDVNYFDQNREYSFVKDKADTLNEYARAFFRTCRENVSVRFLTPSRYEE